MSDTPCKDCCTIPTVAVGYCRTCYSRRHNNGTLPVRPTVEQRFHASYDVDENGCWIWNRSTSGGYGAFSGGRLEGGHGRAHRYSYIIHRGEIPVGMSVLHDCDKPACVNPDHLHLGTHLQNMLEAADRNRFKRKLDDTQIRAVLALRNKMTQADIGALFGINKQYVNNIFRGRVRRRVTGIAPVGKWVRTAKHVKKSKT